MLDDVAELPDALHEKHVERHPTHKNFEMGFLVVGEQNRVIPHLELLFPPDHFLLMIN